MSDTALDAATDGKQTHGFQAEVNKLLHLVVHSLYSNKEIFLRELISNASDACDKLRFAAVKNDDLYAGDSKLQIRVSVDEEARSITVSDNGIGMSRDEVVENIGTIAKSGTKAFMEQLSGDQAKDSQLIGQFGVGFYASFIVADKVTLTTRKAGEREATRWESDGVSDYTLEAVGKPERGTEVVLHLREDADEFLNDWQLRNLIGKYSDHVAFPVMMPKQPEPSGEDGEEAKPDPDARVQWEQVNKGAPLWTRPKSEIKDEEYQEFYKHVSHDFGEPLSWMHNRVEGKLEYTSLFYIPSQAPFDLWDRDQTRGVKLYVQRVFIMDDAEKMLPRYLRFVRGVVDSSDLPLNVSRELLQSNKVLDSVRSGSVKKILGHLEKMAKNEPEEYAKFWEAFGAVIKEGPGEDFGNREQIAGLLRFASTENDDASQNVSLADYIGRMKSGQEKIYYITADSPAAARNSPHLEVFAKKGIEVLLLTDRVDEWMLSSLTEFDGKQLQSVAKGELDLGETESEEEKEALKKAEEEAKPLLERVAKVLGERVKEVRVTHRLTESPACIVAEEGAMSGHLERLLKEAGQDSMMPGSKPILEINPTHPIITKMEHEPDEDRFGEWSTLVMDQAILAEGGDLDDPGGFVRRMNKMMLDLAG